MPKYDDFNDSAMMFGDEAAHIPTAHSGPKLCVLPSSPYSKPSVFGRLWTGLSHGVGQTLSSFAATRTTQSQFAQAVLPATTKPVTVEPLAYNNYGLPKPQ